MKIHIVQQGDTLWKLAKKYDVDFEQLKAVNNHLSNPDVIMPGMKIKIPTGSVPVKKQIVKKEAPIQVKEQPKVKEMPKMEVKVPFPKIPEVAKSEPQIVQQPVAIQPIQQQPMLTQQQYEQHLHNMNMNFNIYKPMPSPVVPVAPAPAPQVPPPPKMPIMKELPKVEKPIPMAPPLAPLEKEIPKEPKFCEMPMGMPVLPAMPAPTTPVMQQACYPITGIVPGCSYNVPPIVQQYAQYPHSSPMGAYGYPQGPVGPVGPPMPSYPQVGYGTGQTPTPPNYGMAQQVGNDDFPTEMPPMAPGANMQMPPNYWGQPNLYGDVTVQQPQMQWGYPQQPMYHQPPVSPHPAHQRRTEEEDTKK